MIYEIKDAFGNRVKLQPRIELYGVTDSFGNKLPGLGVMLDEVGASTAYTRPYAALTVSFGEFIGIKDSAYIDVNNCDFANQLLEQGIAENTGFSKASGFCHYPLWHFTENFLREHGPENYEKYSAAYDRYMGVEAEEPTKSMEMGGM